MLPAACWSNQPDARLVGRFFVGLFSVSFLVGLWVGFLLGLCVGFLGGLCVGFLVGAVESEDTTPDVGAAATGAPAHMAASQQWHSVVMHHIRMPSIPCRLCVENPTAGYSQALWRRSRIPGWQHMFLPGTLRRVGGAARPVGVPGDGDACCLVRSESLHARVLCCRRHGSSAPEVPSGPDEQAPLTR